MSDYRYSDRQLRAWPPAAAAAGLWERAKHLEEQVAYWKHRAKSAEQRMLNHESQEPK